MERRKDERRASQVVAGPYGVLMPLIRKTLWAPDGKPPEAWSEMRECSVIKRLVMHRTVSQIETAILGLVRLRDSGQITWLKPGQKVTCRALYNSRSGVSQMFELATAWYWREGRIKKSPRPTERVGDILERVLRTASSPDNTAWREKYVKHIKSPEWKITRLRIIARANGHCEKCLEPGSQFDVHHLTYVRLGNEWDEDLQAVCWECHAIADAERANAGRN